MRSCQYLKSLYPNIQYIYTRTYFTLHIFMCILHIMSCHFLSSTLQRAKNWATANALREKSRPDLLLSNISHQQDWCGRNSKITLKKRQQEIDRYPSKTGSGRECDERQRQGRESCFIKWDFFYIRLVTSYEDDMSPFLTRTFKFFGFSTRDTQ
jgi:hypothetical protein